METAQTLFTIDCFTDLTVSILNDARFWRRTSISSQVMVKKIDSFIGTNEKGGINLNGILKPFCSIEVSIFPIFPQSGPIFLPLECQDSVRLAVLFCLC